MQQSKGEQVEYIVQHNKRLHVVVDQPTVDQVAVDEVHKFEVPNNVHQVKGEHVRADEPQYVEQTDAEQVEADELDYMKQTAG